MNFILVGHGSIGSKYKDLILKKYTNKDNLIIVDKNQLLLEKLREEKLNCFENLNQIVTKDITFGIVANWGPDHIKTANQLIDLGCKRIIIEKPLSTRKDDLQIFKKRCIKENIFVTIHHHWPYTNILEVIKNAEFEYKLGEAKGIRISGGAVCLSTNGTHYFDLSCDILRSTPKNIFAELELDYINPRDKSLLNIGGMAAYKMKNGNFISVSLSNENSQSIRLEIIYRNSIIELTTDLNLNLYQRDMEDVKKYDDKITRYGDLHLKNVLQFKDNATVENVLENLVSNDLPKVSIDKAEISILMVLGAIQSHLQGIRVDYDNIADMGLMFS